MDFQSEDAKEILKIGSTTHIFFNILQIQCQNMFCHPVINVNLKKVIKKTFLKSQFFKNDYFKGVQT